MQIINTQIKIGLEAPVRVIHASDTHLTYADMRDGERKVKLAEGRLPGFPHAEDVLAKIGEVSKAENLPAECATALMTGMTTDTNNFNNSVYPTTLIMASQLLAAGVDRDFILQKINQEHTENRLRLKGFMLKDLLKVTDDGVAFMVLDKEAQLRYNMQEGDTEGFVNEPLSIAKVRMSIFAREDKEEVRISIRSKKGTSANRCARLFFDGGGHENAAGGKLLIPIGEVEEYIRKYTHIYMTEYEK